MSDFVEVSSSPVDLLIVETDQSSDAGFEVVGDLVSSRASLDRELDQSLWELSNRFLDVQDWIVSDVKKLELSRTRSECVGWEVSDLILVESELLEHGEVLGLLWAELSKLVLREGEGCEGVELVNTFN